MGQGRDRVRGAPFAGRTSIGRLGSLLVAPLILLVVACSIEPAAGAAKAPVVILVSLDGTRPADVTEADLGAVAALRTQGAAARSMIGVSPSNTFPSHVSLVTGVAPERHGLVNNRFFDPELGEFVRSDIPRFIEVEPLWSWLEGRGVVTASYYWVGSEGAWPPSGRGPTHWKPFSSRTGEQAKVDQILAWLDLEDEARRPRLITSWFHGADHAGHQDGPGAESVRESLREQNAAIAALIAGLEARDAFEHTTLIFVSDHGMVGTERAVELGTVLRDQGVRARVRGIGGFASVYLDDPGDADQVALAVEVARAQGLDAHPRVSAPADWRVDHARFGDVVVRAPIGTAITYPGLSIEGFHGYAPEEASMRAVFFARGRGAEPGTDLGDVRAVDVAPTVLQLLGFEAPERMEGEVIEALRVADVPAAGESARLGRPAEPDRGDAP